MKSQQDIKGRIVINRILSNRSVLLLTFVLIFVAAALPVRAQNNGISRISAAERSDGKGFVIRYHLNQKADSFRVYQPSTDLIQMTLYGGHLDTSSVQLSGDDSAFDEIKLYNIPSGIGVDIYLPDSTYFRANAYPDGKSDDLLLGLTYSEREKIAFLTEGLEPVVWQRLTTNVSDVLQVPSGEAEQAAAGSTAYTEVKSKMKFDVVVIDPGHGGHDVGAIGYKGVYEKDIALNIAKKLGGYIEQYLPGVKVVYTREDDRFVELEQRGPIANRSEGDLFVSIHCNKFHTPRPHGTETYFLGLERSKSALEVMKRENNIINGGHTDPDKVLSPEQLLVYELQNSGYIATSERIAGMVEEQFRDRAQRRSRGVKQGRLVVLYQASMPSILVETGFISNPGEQRFLSSTYGQEIIASAIFRAIRNYKEEYERSQHFNTN